MTSKVPCIIKFSIIHCTIIGEKYDLSINDWHGLIKSIDGICVATDKKLYEGRDSEYINVFYRNES